MESADWHFTPPAAVRDDIEWAASLSHFAYWWRGPTHHDFDALKSLTEDDPGLTPPSFGPLKPFESAGEVHRCIRDMLHGLGDDARVDLWEPAPSGLCCAFLVVQATGRLVITFRGTFDMADLADDATCRLVAAARAEDASPTPPGKVHQGFLCHLTRAGAHKRLLERVRALASVGSAERPVDVLLVGHSLGAASAILLASLLARDGRGESGPAALHLRMTLVTFGAPRTGDAVFADALSTESSVRHYRVQNHLDFVTRMPYWAPWPGAWKHSQSWHVWLSEGRVRCSPKVPFTRASLPLGLGFLAKPTAIFTSQVCDPRHHKMGTRFGYRQALRDAAWSEELMH